MKKEIVIFVLFLSSMLMSFSTIGSNSSTNSEVNSMTIIDTQEEGFYFFSGINDWMVIQHKCYDPMGVHVSYGSTCLPGGFYACLFNLCPPGSSTSPGGDE